MNKIVRFLILVLMGTITAASVFAQEQVPTAESALDLRFKGQEIRKGIGILPVQFKVGRDAFNGNGQISIDDLKIALIKGTTPTTFDKPHSKILLEAEGPAYALRRFFTENHIVQINNLQILQVKVIGVFEVNDGLEINADAYVSAGFNFKNRNDNLDFDMTEYDNFRNRLCANCGRETPGGTFGGQIGADISIKLRDRVSFVAFFQRYHNETGAPVGPAGGYWVDDSMDQNRVGSEIDVSLQKRKNLYNIMLFARDELLVNTRSFESLNGVNAEVPISPIQREDTYRLLTFGIKAVVR